MILLKYCKLKAYKYAFKDKEKKEKFNLMFQWKEKLFAWQNMNTQDYVNYKKNK